MTVATMDHCSFIIAVWLH